MSADGLSRLVGLCATSLAIALSLPQTAVRRHSGLERRVRDHVHGWSKGRDQHGGR